MSPPSGCKPAIDLVEMIHTPERLAIDDDKGRTEDAGRDRPRSLALEGILYRRIIDRRARRCGIRAAARCDGRRDVGVRDVDIVTEKSAIERMCHSDREHRIAVLQPEYDARRRLGRNRKRRWHPKALDAVEFRAAGHIPPRVVALERYLGQRHGAGLFEYDPEEDRMPVHTAVVSCGERLDLLRSEVAVRRGEVEVEIDRCAHGCPGNCIHAASARLMTSRWMSLVPS